MAANHTSSAARGKTTEQMVVTYLRSAGFPNAERTVRTGYRSHATGRELADRGDVDGTPGITWQVKSLRPATAAERAVPGWMAELEQQRVAAGGDLGVLVVRRDYYPAADWWAFLPWTPPVDPSRTPIVIRMSLADVVWLLRSNGYGEPLTAPLERIEG